MSDYIEGLEKAIEILNRSSEVDEMVMEGFFLIGAKEAIRHAKQLIKDEIVMTKSV